MIPSIWRAQNMGAKRRRKTKEAEAERNKKPNEEPETLSSHEFADVRQLGVSVGFVNFH